MSDSCTRKYIRVECETPAKIVSKNFIGYGDIANIGAGGCKLSPDKILATNLKFDDVIKIEFSFDNNNFKCIGKVIRDIHRAFPIGIKFFYENGKDKCVLNRLILQNYFK